MAWLFNADKATAKIADLLEQDGEGPGERGWQSYITDFAKKFSGKNTRDTARKAVWCMAQVEKKHPDWVRGLELEHRTAIRKILDSGMLEHAATLEYVGNRWHAPPFWADEVATAHFQHIAWVTTWRRIAKEENDASRGQLLRNAAAIALYVRQDNTPLFESTKSRRIEEIAGVAHGVLGSATGASMMMMLPHLLARVSQGITAQTPPGNLAGLDDVDDNLVSPHARGLVSLLPQSKRHPLLWSLALNIEAHVAGHGDEEGFRSALWAFVQLGEATPCVPSLLQIDLGSQYKDKEGWVATQIYPYCAGRYLTYADGDDAGQLAAASYLARHAPDNMAPHCDKIVAVAEANREARKLLWAGAKRAAGKLGVPLPGDRLVVSDLEKMCEGEEKNQSEFALLLFKLQPLLRPKKRGELAPYLDVLRILNTNRKKEHARLVSAVAELLPELRLLPLVWDDVAWSAARMFCGDAAQTLRAYKGWLSRSKALLRDDILARELRQGGRAFSKLQILASDWKPGEHSEDLQIRVFRWAITAGVVDPRAHDYRAAFEHFPTAEAWQTPRGHLVDGAAATTRGELLKAEQHLERCREEEPSIDSDPPLTWNGELKALFEAAESWASQSGPAAGKAGDLWGLVDRLRWGHGDPNGALRAAAEALTVPAELTYPDEQKKRVLTYLEHDGLGAKTLVSAADLLVQKQQLTREAMVLTLAICDRYGGRLASQAEALLTALQASSDVAVKEDAWKTWALLPGQRGDAEAVFQRLRQADEGNTLPLEFVGGELDSIVGPLLRGKQDRESDALWYLEVCARRGQYRTVLGWLEDLDTRPSRRSALELFFAGQARVAGEEELERELLERSVEFAETTGDHELMVSSVMWLMDLHPRARGKKPLQDLLATAFLFFAKHGDADHVAAGATFLLDQKQTIEVHEIVMTLLKLHRQWLGHDKFELHERVIAAQKALDRRRSMRYELASVLQESGEHPLATRVFTQHFDGDVLGHDSRQKDGAALLGRVRELIEEPGGEKLGSAHLLLGRIEAYLGEDTGALEAFQRAHDFGEHSGTEPEVAALLERAEADLLCAARLLHVSILAQLNKPLQVEIWKLHEEVETLAAESDRQEWLAGWLRAIDQQVCPLLDEWLSRKCQAKPANRWRLLRAWADDLGPRREGASVPASAQRRLLSTLEALEETHDDKLAAWIAARLEEAPARASSDLLLAWLGATAREEMTRHAPSARPGIRELIDRSRQEARDFDLEVLRQRLHEFVEASPRLDKQHRLWLVELDLRTAETEDAATHCRLALKAKLGLKADAFLEVFVARAANFSTPDERHARCWVEVLNLAGTKTSVEIARWAPIALHALRQLASHDLLASQQLDVLRRFHEAARNVKGGQWETWRTEVTLGFAILEFLHGDLSAAEDLLASLIRTGSLEKEEPVDPDPLQVWGVRRPTTDEERPARLTDLVDALAARKVEQLEGAEERSSTLPGHVFGAQYRLCMVADTPNTVLARQALHGLQGCGEKFVGVAQAGLDELLGITREDERTGLLIDHARLLLRPGRRKVAEIKKACGNLRELVPPWPSEPLPEGSTDLLPDVRDVLVGAAEHCSHRVNLLLLWFDLEMAAEDWSAASAIASLVEHLPRSHKYRGETLLALNRRLWAGLDTHPQLLPLVRRFLQAHPDLRDEAMPGLERLLESFDEDDSSARAGIRREVRLLVSCFPDDVRLREWLCALEDSTVQTAFQHRAVVKLTDDEDTAEGHLGLLELSLEHDPFIAYLYGRSRLAFLDRFRGGASRDDFEEIDRLWRDAAQAGVKEARAGWSLFPALARLHEDVLEDLDEAHTWKLEEAALRHHDVQSCKDVIALWRRARQQERSRLSDLDDPKEVLRFAHISRLLLEPQAAIPVVQNALDRLDGEARIPLLFELGLCFALNNNHDLAAVCHESVHELTRRDPRDRPTPSPDATGQSALTTADDRDLAGENLFHWGVSLAYLQQTDEARKRFQEVLARNVNHEQARQELRKLDLPDGIRQFYQLAELTSHSWSGVLQLLTSDSVDREEREPQA